MADPGTGDVRTDTPTITTATTVAISKTSLGEVDMSFALAQLTDGDAVAVQEVSDASHWARLRVTGTAVDNGTWFQFPVVYVEGSATSVAKATNVLLQFGYGSGSDALDQATADGLYVNLTGDTMTGALNVQGVTVGDSASFGASYEGFETPTAAVLAGNAGDKSVYVIAKDSASGVLLRAGNDSAKQVQVQTTQVLSTLPVTLPGDPTAALHSATKQYVDARTPKITVSSTAPSSPAVGDIWIDTT